MVASGRFGCFYSLREHFIGSSDPNIKPDIVILDIESEIHWNSKKKKKKKGLRRLGTMRSD